VGVFQVSRRKQRFAETPVRSRNRPPSHRKHACFPLAGTGGAIGAPPVSRSEMRLRSPMALTLALPPRGRGAPRRATKAAFAKRVRKAARARTVGRRSLRADPPAILMPRTGPCRLPQGRGTRGQRRRRGVPRPPLSQRHCPHLGPRAGGGKPRWRDSSRRLCRFLWPCGSRQPKDGLLLERHQQSEFLSLALTIFVLRRPLFAPGPGRPPARFGLLHGKKVGPTTGRTLDSLTNRPQ